MTPPIIWQPHAPTLVVAAAIVLAVALVALRARTLGKRFGGRVAAGLAVPSAVVAALIITALIDPSLPAHAAEDRRVLVLIDQSTSMDVHDAGTTKRERAEKIATTLRVPDGVRVERRWFDSALHDAPASSAGERGTDLAACLQQLTPQVAAGDCAGIVVISDGGDEPVAADGLPAAPIAAIAVGADAETLDNVGLVAIDAPDGAEKELEIEIAADLRATGSTGFRAELGVLPATLSVASGESWREVARVPVDLAHGRARAVFRYKPDSAGDVRLRIAVPAAPGEVTALDNARTLAIDVRERSLRVLYFSRTLGLDFKPLRAELARDPGISLTALYRTVGARLGGGGERFVVQGDRLVGDETLDEGFPSEAAQLARYDVVILGSFAADSWPLAQQQALADHVVNGAALVLIGGENSFGIGGYATSPLGALMPWQIADGEPPPARGEFAVAVPPAAVSHPALAGVVERLATTRALIASCNRPGPLRAGASALLASAIDGGDVAVAAAQPYGKGRVLGLASDTLWRLARADHEGGGAYGLFWRQSLRWLADRGDAGSGVRVRWDRARYRPGETAIATVRVDAPGRPRVVGSVEGPGGRRDLAAVSEPGEAGALRLDVPFGTRGDYRVRIVAEREDGGSASYERAFVVAPQLPEGARLARDDAGLKALAEANGGVAVGEERMDDLDAWLATVCRPRSTGTARSLVFSSPWWLIALIAALVGDWTLRRKRNLL